MLTIRETDVFAGWLGSLRDVRGRARIVARIERLASGHFGDTKSVGDGVGELRIPFGPGYRVYFTQHGDLIVILLCGGVKGSQRRDIDRAKALARDLKE